jgi:pimeloyl-ACP methyl ester carboxylesterase
MKRFSPAFTACLLLVAQYGVSGAQTDTVYARPGRLVSAGAHRLNLYCMGSGSPTVVFDSGWEDWAPAWSVVQPRVATFTRACAYDRAGAGFSEAGPVPLADRSSEYIQFDQPDVVTEAIREVFTQSK